MAELRATPMSNPIMGLLADRLKQVQQFGAKPFGYENPPVEMLMNLLGVPAIQQTMERMAYGEPLTTGSGMTTKPRPEAIEAAMAVAPVAGLLGKVTKGLPVGASIKDVSKQGLLAIKEPSAIENIYHGTTSQAAKSIEKSGFDLNKSADGTIWFTTNPQIGEVAASGKGGVVQRSVDSSKMKLGGWNEADKYSTDELINMGFDGLKLSDNGQSTYQIFNVDKLSKPLQKAVDETSVAGLLGQSSLPNDYYELNSMATQAYSDLRKAPSQEASDYYKSIIKARDEAANNPSNNYKPPVADVVEEGYQGQHAAPTKDSGAPLWNLKETYPDDFYSSNGARYYGDGADEARDRMIVSQMQGMKNRPDKMVTIYRAVPKDVPTKEALNMGDWVTLDRQYAKEHGEGALNNDYKIVKKSVKARDLFTNGDSIYEMGYDPQPFISKRDLGLLE